MQFWIIKTACNKISRRKQFKEEGLNYLEELAKYKKIAPC